MLVIASSIPIEQFPIDQSMGENRQRCTLPNRKYIRNKKENLRPLPPDHHTHKKEREREKEKEKKKERKKKEEEASIEQARTSTASVTICPTCISPVQTKTSHRLQAKPRKTD